MSCNKVVRDSNRELHWADMIYYLSNEPKFLLKVRIHKFFYQIKFIKIKTFWLNKVGLSYIALNKGTILLIIF